MPRQPINTFRDATADEVAAMNEIRHRPAYALCRVWLDQAIAGHPAPFTKGLLIDIGSVTVLFKAAWIGLDRDGPRMRPTIGAALADDDAEVSVALALHDAGAVVALARGRYTGDLVLCCNMRENALRALELTRKQLAAHDGEYLRIWGRAH
jgi:hypothetical protein